MTTGGPAEKEPPASALDSRFDLLAESLITPVLSAGPDGRVDYANPAARELFWLSGDAILGDGWLQAIPLDDRERVRRQAKEVAASSNAAVPEFPLDILGQRRWVRASLNPIAGTEGGGGGWIAIFDDITGDRAATDDLAHRATHDGLTGLPNRTLLLDRLGQAVARCERHHQPLAVFFMDLDGFKGVNDEHGHHRGDGVLCEVASRLAGSIRVEDTAARLGGDEFVVVSEGVTRTAAQAVAARLAAGVASPIVVDGVEFTLRASVGVAWTDGALESPEQLLARADQGMYIAKQQATPWAFADRR
ncbi:MAG: diguanylate cyclase domain-containing protein [Acidimicrobiales bacterium]